MRKLILFTLLSAKLGWATPHQIKTYRDSNLDGRVSINHFRTKANYGSSGQSQLLINNGEFVATDLELGGRYSFSSKWALSSQIHFSGSESNDGDSIRSNSNISSLQVSSDHLLLKGWLDVVADIDFKIPFYRVKADTDDSLIDEGDSHLQALIELQKQTKAYIGYFFSGYKYRDEGRAALIPYGVGGQYQLKSWAIGLELRGFTKISDDKFTDSPVQRTQVTSRVNAGSLHYYAVNPTKSEWELYGRTPMGKEWNLVAGFGTTLGGVNTSAGWNVFTAFEFTGGPVYSPKTKSRDFIEDTKDGVDQKLFEEEDLTEEL